MKEFVMKRLTHIKTAFLAALFGLFMIGVAYADGGARYEVTITNITRGQVITPPVLISHKGSFELFSLGDPTIPQLATLAETGDPTDLLDYLATRSDVYDVTAADGPVLYGESVVLKIRVRGHARYLSAAGMLASTNDAFFGVRQVRVPSYGMRRITAEAYDAGSEANSELCSTIPGPPCEPPNNRDTEQWRSRSAASVIRLCAGGPWTRASRFVGSTIWRIRHVVPFLKIHEQPTISGPEPHPLDGGETIQ
jgi:hypothetical protein